MKKLLLPLLLSCVATLPLLALPVHSQDKVLRDFLWEEFTSKPPEKRPKIGLALSAGGVRGFAHVGVLEVLTDANVPIDMMAGTSMGAVVGSLYAAGFSIEKLWDISGHMSIDKITSDFNLMGFIRIIFYHKLPSSSNLQNFFDEQLGKLYFENLRIPFAAAAMDVKTGERVVFNSGPLSIAVRASMNIPGVFEPVQYRQRYLVDGAVVDYLPVDMVKEMNADYVIASITPPDFFSDTPQTVASYLLRTGDVRGAAMIEESSKKANFVLINRVLDVSVLDLKKLHQAGEIGIKETRKKLDDLQEDILLFSIDYVVND